MKQLPVPNGVTSPGPEGPCRAFEQCVAYNELQGAWYWILLPTQHRLMEIIFLQLSQKTNSLLGITTVTPRSVFLNCTWHLFWRAPQGAQTLYRPALHSSQSGKVQQ